MSMPLRPSDPTTVGRYEVVGRLGEGGMGTVFLGRDPHGRMVAIKMVRPEFAYESEFRGRFRSEVNRAKQVPPFSTAEVLDADPDHEPPYLVVEYVDGPSLAAEIRAKGSLSEASVHGVAVGIATALTAIHGAGVIHRDLKPANVLFARGGIKVIDFGIARAFDATSQHTRTDQMVGTVAYMAPERFDPSQGRPVTSAADIFAWGAVVMYAATGRTPFAADSAPATAMRILTQPPDLSGLPPSLLDPVELALAKDPADRPSARELLDLLLAGESPRTVAADGATTNPRISAPVPASARPRRRRWIPLTATAAVLAVGGLVASHYLTSGFGGTAGPTTGSTPGPVLASGSGTPPLSTATTQVEDPTTPEDRLAAVLRGSRLTLIHVAEIDRDLALDANYTEVEAGDGTGPKSEFVLEPLGVDYQIRSLHDPAAQRETCLGVKIIPDESSQMVPAECGPTKATVFSLSPTGKKDDKNRPTYWIRNDTYGFLQWSTATKAMFVEEVGDAAPLSTFSFVDRGPLPTPSPGG
jgi:serine/threonine protein kinase